MMKRIITLLMITCLITVYADQVYGQKATIHEIKCLPEKQYYNVTDSTIIFPVISTAHPIIDSTINGAIQAVIFDDVDSTQSILSALKQKTAQGLINMSYEVTYTSNKLLSLRIDMEGCGAHCSTWSEYFTFDITTGHLLTMNDFISSAYLAVFEKKVKQDKINTLQQYLKEEKKAYLKKEMDADTWSMIKSLTADCLKEFSLTQFALWGNNPQVISPCEFPVVIRAYSPGIELHYSYTVIQNWLAPAYKMHLLQTPPKK